MFARLGFSVAVSADSDIFIIDEVLAVGDPPFKKKCIRRIKRGARRGPHDRVRQPQHHPGAAGCATRALVLEDGRLGFDGAGAATPCTTCKYDADGDNDEDGDGGEL